jgi:adenylate kinase family enzyme
MKKVAVFGNTGGGKSTLAIKLSNMTGLPLYVLDKIQFRSGGTEVSREDFKIAHENILAGDRWIIDGYGSPDTLWPRLSAADTLVYVDLPLHIHFCWVTKRFITGRLNPPEGWPKDTPILKSSLSSYRVLWLCHKYLTPKYRDYVKQVQSAKTVYHLRSSDQISQFLKLIEHAAKFENGPPP